MGVCVHVHGVGVSDGGGGRVCACACECESPHREVRAHCYAVLLSPHGSLGHLKILSVFSIVRHHILHGLLQGVDVEAGLGGGGVAVELHLWGGGGNVVVMWWWWWWWWWWCGDGEGDGCRPFASPRLR